LNSSEVSYRKSKKASISLTFSQKYAAGITRSLRWAEYVAQKGNNKYYRIILMEKNWKTASFYAEKVAQAVSSWLPTAAVRVQDRAACGVCGGQSDTGAGFLLVLRFPLPIIPPTSPSS
jgi:hypothetical protein